MGKQIIVSIGREYGSGGLDIGRKIAEDFGMKCYDKNILDEIARAKNIESGVLEKFDEAPKKFFDSRRVGAYSNSMEDILAELQFEYLQEKAASGESFVIVGRCAEKALKENENLISVFILAEPAFRAARIAKSEGISEDAALTRIRQVDKKRKQYHDRHAGGRWGDSRTYDLCLKSSRLGIEKTVEVLENYIRARM